MTLFQIMMDPPEVPFEGRNSKHSKPRGQKFLIKEISKWERFVSCKHTISQLFSKILSLMEFHFFPEFMPHSTFLQP
jgi:hypothetical protein